MSGEGVMKEVNLPKLYRPVNLKFWSLRNQIGASGGVIFGCDQQVTRKCRRVICPDGWKWQICREHKNQEEWDWVFGEDQECLNEQGMDLWGLKWR